MSKYKQYVGEVFKACVNEPAHMPLEDLYVAEGESFLIEEHREYPNEYVIVNLSDRDYEYRFRVDEQTLEHLLGYQITDAY